MSPTPRAFRAVLFDLDGTLLDTAPDMAAAINALRVENGLEPMPYEAIRPFVSHGSFALVRLGFPQAVEPQFEQLRQRFLVLYRERLTHDTRPFPGVPELLETLERNGLPWGIVTNKPGWLTEPLLHALGLQQRARSVVSGDTLPERKPHPRPLLHAAAALAVEPTECVYVGDAERDVIAARAASMCALVARFGYIGPHDDIQSWPADGWIDSPLDVLDWLTELPRSAAAR